mgnify:CR=1 FL=1
MSLFAAAEPRLWRENGFVDDDPWMIVEEAQGALPEHAVLPLAGLLARISAGEALPQRLGVRLVADDDVSALAPHLGVVSLVALTFRAFNDGRAFSQASLLRERHGYGGDIRAIGDVLIDQVALMLRCGVTSVLVSHPPTIRRLAEGRIGGIDQRYQPSAAPDAAHGSYSWRRRAVA